MRTALEQTIQAFGAREWRRISGEVLSTKTSDPLIIPSLPEFKHRFLGELLTFKRYFTTWNIRNVLGFLSSWPVPHRDIEFRERGAAEKSLFVHKPLVASTLIVLQWWKCIIEKALNQRGISLTEEKYLRKILGFLKDFEVGFSKGVYRKDLLIRFFLALRKKRQVSQLVIEISPQLLRWFSLQAGFSK